MWMKVNIMIAEIRTFFPFKGSIDIIFFANPFDLIDHCFRNCFVIDRFYDGLTFHRIINGFMIQGGCPLGTGTGGPGHTIKGEFSQNGVINNLKHTPGVLSMARSMMPDSAGSQFFIMHKAAPHLDGQYAAFGKIIEGMDVVNKIAEVATDYSDKPLEPQVMKTVTVEE